MTEAIETGPIDYLIVEWSGGAEPNGEALAQLVDLVDRQIIRILDLAFLQKDEQGNIAELEMSDFDLDGDPDLALFVGASSGLLGEDDYEEAGNALENGVAGAILVYENTWAAPFATALRGSGAQLVAQGRIPVNAMLAALDDLESADS